jgi:WD40 repeat protein
MQESIGPEIFRLFVSSTFSDFVAEREALQHEVFPALERYCAERGARFQAVDLRWGITENAQRNHDTMRICLEEVRRCQRLSPSPNFAVLLGDRYGWEPVPARIPQEHWESMKSAARGSSWPVIERSYRLDQNAIPPVYCLRERAVDPATVVQQEEQLLQALREAARGFRGNSRLPYFSSATHQEIVLGALSSCDEQGEALNPEKHVHVYVRHLESVPHDASASDFIDWDRNRGQVTPGARNRLLGLKSELRTRLGTHVHDLQTQWSAHGRNGAVDKAYLKRFCDLFLEHQKQLIDAEFGIRVGRDQSVQQDEAHRAFGVERARVFVGREVLLAKIARYTGLRASGEAERSITDDQTTSPLILLGAGGSGKSALLARSAQEALKEGEPPGTVILQRYIGGVPGTESLVRTLGSLVADLASLYGQSLPHTPEDSKELREVFHTVLSCASAERALVLYLDALDQLDPADCSWMLEWLPRELPAHVRVVASVRTGTSVEQAARRNYPAGSLLEVSPMSPVEGEAMLNAWLGDKRASWFNAGIAPSTGRRLTAPQQAAILRAFECNGSALWLKLVYEEAVSWTSWNEPPELPGTIDGLLKNLIQIKLIDQERHPKVFLERALAYLTAGRFGLSESEVARALAMDAEVWEEFRANEKTQRKWEDDKTLPPILWSRLFFDLQPYLGLAQIDGALVMRWFHREFAEAMRARYLSADGDRARIHGVLADAFLSLERELRPDESDDGALFRSTDASGKQVSAAVRRVIEQPWQLSQAGRQQDLWTLLTDFGFCMGKCAANAGDDLVADFSAFEAGGTGAAWAGLVRAQGHLLRRGSPEWPAHRILLQVAMEHADDSPVTRAAQAWLDLGHCDWVWMRRIDRPRTLRISAVLSVMDEHSEGVQGVALLSGQRAVSWSHDKTLVTWDLARSRPTGKLHTLAGASGSGLVGAFAWPGDRVVCWGDTELEVWDLHAARRVGGMTRPQEVIYGALPLEDQAILSWWAPRNEHLAAMRSTRPDLTFRIWRPQADSAQAVPSLDSLDIRELKPLGPLRLAAFCGERLLRVIDQASLQPLCDVAHDDEILGVRVIDGSRACSWSRDRMVQVWDLTTGMSHASFELGTLLSELWVLDAQTLAGVCSTRGQGWPDTDSIFIISLAQGRIVQEIVGHDAPSVTVQRLSDGRLLSASVDNTLRLWRATPQGYAALATVRGHTGAVTGVQVLDDGRLLSWSRDHTLRLWLLDTIEVDSQDPSPAYILDYEILASGAVLLQTNDELRAFPAREDGAITRLPAAAGDRFGKCLVLADGRVVASSTSGQIRLWDPASGQVQCAFSCGEPLTHQLLMLDDNRLAVAGQETLQVWDLLTGRRLHRLDAPSLWQLLHLPDGRVLTIRSQEVLAVWDLQTGVKLRDLTSLRSSTVFARVLPGIGLVTWDLDSCRSRSTLRVWDLDTLDLRREITTTEMVGDGMLGLSDGRIVCWGASVAWAFDPGSDAPPLELRGHEDTRDGLMLMILGGLELSDGHFLTYSSDCSIRVWSVREKAAQRELLGHEASVLQVRELPRRRLLSQSIDNEMILWDLDSGRILDRSASGWLKQHDFEPLWVDHLAGASRWASLWLKVLPRDCLVGAWRGEPVRWVSTEMLRSPLYRTDQSVVAVSGREVVRLGVWRGRNRAGIET